MPKKRPGAPKRSGSGSPWPTAAERPPPPASRKPARATAGSVPSLAAEASTNLTIVGIGASAGGLEAFTQLLQSLPPNTGMAFVLVQHLDPNRESTLASLLSRVTIMPVIEAQDGTRLDADHVYVTPSQMDIVLEGRALKHVPRTRTGGSHMPIDLFLRSLAEVQGRRAVGVVLSGTATDGTLGLQAVKAAGGVTFAQDPSSARFDAMPRSAIHAECVDFVLPPNEIGRELSRVAGEPGPRRPSGEGEALMGSAEEATPLLRIFSALRKVMGTDFTSYRRTTIRRRIGRRMVAQHIEKLSDYAALLEGDPAELQALHQDFLINVTSFFRDPEVYEALSREILPLILKDRNGDGPVRMWVPGCATGEEAYSLAMCLVECSAALPEVPSTMQIFATDLSEAAVEQARAGVYPRTIEDAVSPERLARFFRPVGEGYRVSESLRDLCVFARQDMIQDPPFSRLDLISCRNTLIYLQPELQRQVLSIFHYALAAHRFLVLGPAEAPSPLFTPVNRQLRIYARRELEPKPLRDLEMAAGGEARRPRAALVSLDSETRAGSRSVVRDSDRILLSRFAPPSVLVDSRLQILQFWGDTSSYLAHGRGEASLDITRLVRRGLQASLHEALWDKETRAGRATRRKEGLRVRHGGRVHTVDLEVIPVLGSSAEEPCFLIVFAEARPAQKKEASPRRASRSKNAKDLRIAYLEQQLAAEELAQESRAEENDAAREELQAANEEILCSNEEMQSINEALETTKEELQAGNEELTTLNEALNKRNIDLSVLGDDLGNLLSSVNIPIIMLGRDLRLRRFTPAASVLMSLIPADVGRPLGDLKLMIDEPDIEQLINTVIENGSVLEREVRDHAGRYHTLRIRPFITRDNRVDGAVVILIDIDELKRASRLIEQARDFADGVVDTARSSLLILDANLHVERANQSFFDTFGVTPGETLGRHFCDLGGGQWKVPELRTRLEAVLSEHASFDGIVVASMFPVIGHRTMVLNGRRLRQVDAEDDKILLAVEDVNKVRTGEDARAAILAEAQLNAELHASRLKDEFVATVSHELRGPLNAIAGWAHVLQGGAVTAEVQARGLAAVDRAVKAQKVLIDDLLDMSRIVAGKLRLEPRVVDLAPIAAAVGENLGAALEAKELTLELISESSPAFVFGDPDRLQQVVWNLVSNAVKFTPRQGRIRVWIGKVGTCWHLRVSDTGQGIDPAFLPHLFERFRQGDATSRRSHSGLGLGLAIVRHLVELHGGTVGAVSAGVGQGSTFTVSLPVPPVLPQSSPAVAVGVARSAPAALESAPEPAALRGARVLVVEDDADSREILKTLLESYGAIVAVANSADEALRKLDQELPDVLLSDIGMPERDGFDLIRAVRGRSPARGGTLPAVALTAFAAANDRERALAAGFQAYLTKPASPPEIAGVLADLVRRRPVAP